MKEIPPLSASTDFPLDAKSPSGDTGTRSPRAIGAGPYLRHRARRGGGAYSDTRRRSLVKAITWRLIGAFVLAIVTRSITGSWREAEIITATYTAIAVVLFYAHERVWQRIRWGKR